MFDKRFFKARLILLKPRNWAFVAFGWPTFTFHLFAFFFHRNLVNATLIPLAALFDACLFGIIDSMVSSWQNSALTRLVWRSRNCRISKLPLEDLLEKHSKELFRFVYHPENLGIEDKLLPLAEQIRAYVIEPPVSAHITAFQDLNGSCTIFFNDRRERFTASQRFNLMHELGHATKANAIGLTRLTFLPRFLVSSLWVLVFCTGPWFYTVTALSLAYVIRFVWQLSPAKMQNVALHQEMAADHFAARNADLESVQRVLLARSLFPSMDSQLGKLNGKRNEFLMSVLKARLAGEQIPELPDSLALSWKVSLADASIFAALGFLGISASWIGVLGAGIVVLAGLATFIKGIQPGSFYQRDLVVSTLDEWVKGPDPSCSKDSLAEFIIRMNNNDDVTTERRNISL
jgi:hypothetical protein